MWLGVDWRGWTVMSQQIDLWVDDRQIGLPTNGTDTSMHAANSMRTTAPALRDLIHQRLVLLDPVGATEEELSEMLGIPGNTTRPRLWELQKAGRVYTTAERRATKSGRTARVWRAR